MKNPQMATTNAQPTTTSRTPYIHWIHCNQCYEQYMQKTRYFYLLACDHVLCVGCIKNISETSVNGPQTFKCSLCREQTRACKLGNDMPSHLKEIFHPEPYLDGLNTYRIMVFQEKHRKRFLEYLDRQCSAKLDKRKDVIRIKDQARKNYQEFQELRNERKQWEKRVITIKLQRRELEEKKKRSIASSISTSDSFECKKLSKSAASNVTSHGITSFSHHSQNHSFIL